jgi:glyoxylase-like metal-dependent hydrolase (beta-lactamase superfamily II)
MLTIVPMVLGPVQTNAYLLADVHTGEAVVIDPAWHRPAGAHGELAASG